MCQVEQLHSLARKSLATRQLITGDYHPDDLPGGIWHHGATLDVCVFLSHMLLSSYLIIYSFGWWSGVVVSALASINEVNRRWARLVLRWATVSGFSSRCRTFNLVCNQPATQGQLSLPSLRGQ